MPQPSFAPLITERLIIRPMLEADIPDLFEVNGDPQVTQFLPYATWQTIGDGQAWFERMSTMVQAGTAQQLVLELSNERKVVGTLLYFHHDQKSARGELGYVLGRRCWGRGLMLEALQAFCGHAFGVAGVRRLEAEVNTANHASLAVLRRLGFTHEGTLRQRWVANGVPHDTRLYGLLAEEWPARTGVCDDRPTNSTELQDTTMAKGYWIARVDVTDLDTYKAYVAANAEPLRKFGGRFLVRAGRFDNPEGASRSRNVVIEFPSYQAAIDCWHSPEYQRAIEIRRPVSSVDLVIIEGYDGPQPA